MYAVYHHLGILIAANGINPTSRRENNILRTAEFTITIIMVFDSFLLSMLSDIEFLRVTYVIAKGTLSRPVFVSASQT